MIFDPAPREARARNASLILRFSCVLALAAIVGTGCNPRSRAATPDRGEESAADAKSGRHPLTGTVVSVDPAAGTALVDHDDIPGIMPAMTMNFKVGAGDRENLRPGQRIRGLIYQAADGFHLEQVWPVEATADAIVTEAARALHQDTMTRGGGAYREVGEQLPDFALYDETGKVVQASRFRGHQLMVNFIFTRCPDPTMCPAATARMIQTQRLARDAGVDNLELISITLDPEYDTPGVLREYAVVRGIDTSNFSFLTGPERAIKDLLTQLGVLVLANGPLKSHTLSTVLVDEKGKIVYRVEGSTWDGKDFVARMHRPAQETPATS
jgi:protein SCO1